MAKDPPGKTSSRSKDSSKKKRDKKRSSSDDNPKETIQESPNGSDQKAQTKSKSQSQSQSYTESEALSSLPQSTIDEYLSSNSVKLTGASNKSPLRPITSFDYLPSSSDPLYAPLKKFPAPTPIQAASWSQLLSGRDVIGIAETGCGKTIAFGIPCLDKVRALKETSKKTRIFSVVITPTRELAMQIYDQLTDYATPIGVGVACIYGGASKDDQRRALKKSSIIVATPGRLKDLLNDQSVDLSRVKYLVLDEADRMLDKGFEQDIKDIISSMPGTNDRQTAMFTATWPTSVKNLAATFMNEPVTIAVGQDPSAEIRANDRITQLVEVIKPLDKQGRLVRLLQDYYRRNDRTDRVLLFCLYKKEAVRIEGFLRSKGFKVAGIHGDLNQAKRFESLQAFKSGGTPLLVATDVAARGLDIPAVKMVVNVTFPLTIEDYVHRIGRYAAYSTISSSSPAKLT